MASIIFGGKPGKGGIVDVKVRFPDLQQRGLSSFFSLRTKIVHGGS
jgi:hypothetical protein